jgi:hypothetical protein
MLFGCVCLAECSAFGAPGEVLQPRRAGTWGAAAVLTAGAFGFGRRRLNPRPAATKSDRRAGDFPQHLPEALARVPEQVGHRDPSEVPNFRVLSVGRRKPLDPTVEDEIYGIGREALLNAFRHSHARNIEIAVTFTSDSLKMVVRDDGCGITPDLVAGNRQGYRGLAGMRDRAERLGGRLRLRSAPRRGTELELSVPAVFSIHSLHAAPAGQSA